VHAIKRGVESFEKRENDVMREKNDEKSMCMEKKERKKYMYEKEKKEEEERRGVARKIKCKEGCHVVERRNFHSFSNHVQSDNEDVIGAS
jgi:hypothetical protein